MSAHRPAEFSATPSAKDQPVWHSIDASSALAALVSSAEGLSENDACVRLERFGRNALPLTRRPGFLGRLRRQLDNTLIYVLVTAAVFALLLGHGLDAAVIATVVLVNTVVGLVQEGRAERALEAIRAMVDPRASVIRDGWRTTLAAERLVPGDVVLIEAGDRIPADLRLLRSRNLKIDEAALTGESVAADKDAAAVPVDSALGDRTSMAYSGTIVAGGSGCGVVVATGARTELGRISGMIGSVETLRTPLLREMDALAGRLTKLILAAAAAAFFAAWLSRGYGPADALMVVVGLAVAAIPEGLTAVMTVTLAVGVRRMATRRAIIRQLPAVETLGAVSVICTDKTGTLTRNEMTARSVVGAAGPREVGGVGYDVGGVIDGAPIENELIAAAILCNDAEVRRLGDVWTVSGDPMEGALLVLADKACISADSVRDEAPRLDEIPFDAAHRFMATLHATPRPVAYIKGAPERIIAMCSDARGPDGDVALDRAFWDAEVNRLAAQGQRVLAFAAKWLPPGIERLTFEQLESGAMLLGLVGFIDPPRAEAVEAVWQAREAGIRVIMITGDHAVTAREIARQIGFGDDPGVLTGSDLDRMSDDALAKAIGRVSVFARTAPEQKLRLVQALQIDGSVVAMTGDGVNDAPALKRADVGIAMGQKGTEASKQAAEMVLADDNFASIVAAVREGRTVYDNLRKVVAWTLPTNGGEALIILGALAFGFALPVTPAQILWINMVTAVALGLSLAFEPTEKGVMLRSPRSKEEGLLAGGVLRRVLFIAVLIAGGSFAIFSWALARGLPAETARTLVVNAVVTMEIFYLFSVRYTYGTSLTLRGVLGTPAVLAGIAAAALAQILFTFWPPLGNLFGTTSIAFADGAVVIAAGVALLAAAEAEKALARLLTRPPRGAVEKAQ